MDLITHLSIFFFFFFMCAVAKSMLTSIVSSSLLFGLSPSSQSNMYTLNTPSQHNKLFSGVQIVFCQPVTFDDTRTLLHASDRRDYTRINTFF